MLDLNTSLSTLNVVIANLCQTPPDPKSFPDPNVFTQMSMGVIATFFALFAVAAVLTVQSLNSTKKEFNDDNNKKLESQKIAFNSVIGEKVIGKSVM